MRPVINLKSIFPGNSEMAQRIRDFDWSNNELGHPENWPEALKTSVRIILTSRHPMFIWWGESLINLDNDGYAAFLHTKHPSALGLPASVVWEEIWHNVIVPRIEIIKNEDSGTFDEAMPFVNFRRGYPEVTYATFSYSPILNDKGQFGGVLCPVSEETERILGQRQMTLLRHLAAKTLEARNRKEAYALIAEACGTDINDIPFALIYELEEQSGTISLEAVIGISCSPKILSNSIWPLGKVFEKNEAIIISDLRRLEAYLPKVHEEYPVTQAIVLPCMHSIDDRKAALILGLSPLRPLDDNYKEFLHLVCAGVSSAIQNADAYEAEKHRAEALAELDRAKTTFFSNVSHEFRTPLTLMLSPVEDALAKTVDPEQRAWIELVYRNALRLQKLVNTLLDFSRIEAGRMQASYEPLNLEKITFELSSVFRSAIEKAGLSFIVDCAILDTAIYVDRDMYEKIVLNLLSNAFKFTLEGGITVMLRDLDSHVELSVTDTGSGIPEKQLQHLFKRFHRIEGTPARTHEGMGIGLALIQELVKLHGGSIEVKSTLGQGSTFTVNLLKGYTHLPADRIQAIRQLDSTMLTTEHYVTEALRWLPSEIDSLNIDAIREKDDYFNKKMNTILRPRIVWADDNADMRDYITRLLSENYNIEAVPDGKSALNALRRQVPDLILADVMMPHLNGFELLHTVRNDRYLRSIPFIILSARAGEESRVEGMAAGADDYLIKPFSARELLARIDAHLKIAALRTAKEQELKESEKKLAMELHGAQKLQHISSRLIEESNINSMCDQVLEAAMTIMNSEFSSIQILDAEQDTLSLLAWKNFHPESAKYWEKVSFKTGTICGAALQHNERIIVPDLYAAEFMQNSKSLPYFQLSGITAVQSTPLTSRDGRVLGMISTHWRERYEPGPYQLALFDVLARQMADVFERHRTQEALKELDRRKDEFLAVLAHELRNPLSPVKNAIYLLQHSKSTEMNLELLQIMERQVNHMTRLVDDLLEISRITTGKIELHKEELSLVDILNSGNFQYSCRLKQNRFVLLEA